MEGEDRGGVERKCCMHPSPRNREGDGNLHDIIKQLSSFLKGALRHNPVSILNQITQRRLRMGERGRLIEGKKVKERESKKEQKKEKKKER